MPAHMELDDRPYKRNPNCNICLSVGRSFPESTTWTRLVPSSHNHDFHLIVEQIWFDTEIVCFLDPAFFWLNIPPSVEPHPWHLGKPWSGRFELHYQWEGIAGFCIVSEYGRVRPKTTLCKGSKLPAVPALQAKDPLEQALPQRRPQGGKGIETVGGWEHLCFVNMLWTKCCRPLTSLRRCWPSTPTRGLSWRTLSPIPIWSR